jgi:methylated-DNA-[protein]-cysteine S-methyltransferase
MPDPATVQKFAVWPSAWGAMGAVSGPGGLARVILPHYQPKDLREMLAFQHPGAVESPGDFADLAARCAAYFNGQVVSFDDFTCDLPPETTFVGRALRACRGIPYGQKRSYSWLAAAAGNPQGARAAGAVLSRNPLPLVIPCHRVLGASGSLGGFSAPGGVEFKRRLLALEAAT